MLKILLGFIAVALSTLIGKKFTEKYALRYEFVSALGEFNSALIRDVSFKKEGVIAIMQREYGCVDFDEYLSQTVKSKIEGLSMPELPNYIPENEKNKILNYFSSIGALNSVSETDLANSMRDYLAEMQKSYKETSLKYRALGSKLGFALGAALFIAII